MKSKKNRIIINNIKRKKIQNSEHRILLFVSRKLIISLLVMKIFLYHKHYFSNLIFSRVNISIAFIEYSLKETY